MSTFKPPEPPAPPGPLAPGPSQAPPPPAGSASPGVPTLTYAARLHIEVANEADFVERYGQSLADSDLFVRHDRPPAADALARLEIFLAGSGQPLTTLIGRVLHARPATFPGEATAGMRLRLLELDDYALAALRRWQQRDVNVAPVELKDKEQSAQFRVFNLQTKQPTPLLARTGPVIGIDLGTVNTCIAVVDRGHPRVLQSREGYETVPSVVFIGGDKKIVVGHKALEKMILEPHRGVSGSKRFLGRPFTSKEVRSLGHFFNYALVAGSNGRTAAQVGDTVIPLEEVSGYILGEARELASKRLGLDISRAVVTVPAYFGETQRQAVRDAGRLAGLHIERIINEPTAAAVAYGFGRGLNSTILVYDLGGGTFDASVLKINGDTMEVLATDGDPFLGGQDFDDRLTEFVLMSFERSHGVSLRKDAVAVQRLRFAVQMTKHQLSEVDSAPLDVPYIVQAPSGSLDVHMVLERHVLEDLTRDLVDRTLAIVDTVLKTAGVPSAKLDDVLLVGGQSRSPHVRRLLLERFGRKPSNAVHPDQAVALGAAIVAEAMQNKLPVHLTDVLPASIRMAVADGQTVVLLPRGTRLPANKHFDVTAVAGDNAELKVVLCRGEVGPVAQNTLLGILRLTLNPQAAGTPARVTVSVSADGLLSATARHPGVGAVQELEVSLV